MFHHTLNKRGHFLPFSAVSLCISLFFAMTSKLTGKSCHHINRSFAPNPQMIPKENYFEGTTGTLVRNGLSFQFTAPSDVKKSKWKDKRSTSTITLECQHVYINVCTVCGCLHMQPVWTLFYSSPCWRTRWIGVIGALNVPPRTTAHAALSGVSGLHTFGK